MRLYISSMWRAFILVEIIDVSDRVDINTLSTFENEYILLKMSLNSLTWEVTESIKVHLYYSLVLLQAAGKRALSHRPLNPG